MTTQTIILVDEKDDPLGSLQVGTACFVIHYEDRYFYRTDRRRRLNLRGTLTAIVFQETEPWIRARLNPL